MKVQPPQDLSKMGRKPSEGTRRLLRQYVVIRRTDLWGRFNIVDLCNKIWRDNMETYDNRVTTRAVSDV